MVKPFARPLVGLALATSLGVAMSAERAIDKEMVVKATLDQAWDAWTTRDGIVSFFAPDAQIEPRWAAPSTSTWTPVRRRAQGRRRHALPGAAAQEDDLLRLECAAAPARGARAANVRRRAIRAAGRRSRRAITLHHTGWGDGGQWDQAYAYFDRAWGDVLGNLKKRFDQGPQDWTEWLKQLEAWRAEAAKQAATPK